MTQGGTGGPTSRGRAELVRLWSTARKILGQEMRTGCVDRTVLGGLQRYLENWSTSLYAMEEAFPTRAEAAQVLRLLGEYGALSSMERADAIRHVLTIVDEVLDRLESLTHLGPGGEGQGPGDGGKGDVGRVKGEERPLHRPASAGASNPGSPSGSPKIHGTPGSSRESARSGAAPHTSLKGDAGQRAKPAPAAKMKQAPAVRARRNLGAVGLDDPIVSLKGVGRVRASKLAKLGIEKVRDLLTHFPRDYRDFAAVKRVADLMFGETASIVGTVEDVQVFPGPQGRVRTTVKVRDESGRISATWFRYGFGGVRISPNTRIALAGTAAGYGYSISLDGPDWEPAEEPPLHTRRIVPVYPLTEGVSDYWLREMMAAVVPLCAPGVGEYLPDWLIKMYDLPPIKDAIASVHFPTSMEALECARHRLAFDELLMVQIGALKRRLEWRSGAKAPVLAGEQVRITQFLEAQPFRLTGAQGRVLSEILTDLGRDVPMTRLLEGDVGSGKTIVAAAALLGAVIAGHQGALMAPTEILAEQHGRTLLGAFANARKAIEALLGRPLRLEVLTGASKQSERQEIYSATQAGEVDVLVGTQALIQEGLGFKKLGLVVIDEQHRFGVMQRTALRQKGGTPHLLVMTATPIPRTLALTIYGDLDLSVIDELPAGRQRVKTHLLGPTERTHAYEHIRQEVAAGRQAFIICPLVEDSPHLEVRAATAEYERLKSGELAELRLALLHGRMRPSQKDQIMLDFKNGLYDVLVSTAVVEVGIDVPNATVMLIEGAERFGMAQLHQFRGRVGRGVHPSTCILLTDSTEESSLARLKTVEAVSDGFRLADEDLKLRGPGEYFGLRQSGFPDFRMADLRDLKLIEMVRSASAELLRRDPKLESPEHAGIASRLEALERAGSS